MFTVQCLGRKRVANGKKTKEKNSLNINIGTLGKKTMRTRFEIKIPMFQSTTEMKDPR